MKKVVLALFCAGVGFGSLHPLKQHTRIENYFSQKPMAEADLLKKDKIATVGEARDVLGVSDDATRSEIRSAFVNLSKKYHPDRLISAPQQKQQEGDKLFKLYGQASDILTTELDKKEAKTSWDININNSSGYPIKVKIVYHDGTKKEVVLANKGKHSLSGINVKSLSYWQDTVQKMINPFASEHAVYGAKEQLALSKIRQRDKRRALTYNIEILSSNQASGKIK